MLPEKITKSNIGVGIGFVLQLGGLVLTELGTTTATVLLGSLLILAGLGIFIWGCMNYAAGKGHSKWVGLVGVTGIIGLIVLIVLPDQHKDAR